jgi:hypothetical protein
MSGIISDNLGRASGLIKAAGGGGIILQMVHATDTTGNRSHSSDTWSQSSNTLDCAITPASASNKIIIMSNVSMRSAGDYACTYYKDSSNLGHALNGFARLKEWTHFSGIVVDHPNTTSEITYKFYFRATDSVETWMNYTDAVGTMTVLEVQV